MAAAVAAWLLAGGGEISPMVAPCWNERTGQGVCATALLPAPATPRERVELVRIPSALALMVDQHFNPFSLDLDTDWKEHPKTSLAIRLLEERYKGQASAWSIYIDNLPLPTSPGTAANETPAAERHQCTASNARSALELVLERRHKALQAEYFDDLCNSNRFPGFCNMFRFEDFLWSQHIVQTRAFTISNKWRALLPFGDYLNHHGSRANVEWHLDERKGGFDFVLVQKHASEDILPGEQLFMSYGAMPPSVLLLQYGFFEGHLSCVDVAFGDKLFCLGRDVRLAKIGKVLRWLSASHVHPEAVLSALLNGLAKQEGRLHAYQNNSCVGIRYESDDAKWHAIIWSKKQF